MRPLLLTLLLAATSLAAEPEIAPFPRAQITSAWTQKIWADGHHNGFPGIAKVGEFYYVAFRSSTSHQDPAASIVVIRASAKSDFTEWKKVAAFTREHDCRDPLIFDNHGRAQVVFHSKEDFFSQSADGLTWTAPAELQTEFVQPREGSELVFTSERRWLFRIRRGPDGAFYSLGRCGIKEKSGGKFGLILYRSEDGVKFSALHTYGEGPTEALPLAGGSGWGHEADVAWTPDGTLVAAIRNSGPGLVVLGKAPLGPWRAFGTGAGNFGGPALFRTAGGGLLLAARDLPSSEDAPEPGLKPKSRPGFPAVCKVWTVTEHGVELPWTLPSGGDCAYQSFEAGARADEALLVYYSSHEYPQLKGVGNNPANLYLAHLRLQHRAP